MAAASKAKQRRGRGGLQGTAAARTVGGGATDPLSASSTPWARVTRAATAYVFIYLPDIASCTTLPSTTVSADLIFLIASSGTRFGSK